MNLSFNIKLAEGYSSPTQKIKKMSESWVDNEMYCPNCGFSSIDKYEENKPVGDFFCSKCGEDYELKSKKDKFGTKIDDGAYRIMIERLKSDNNPNFFLLNYNASDFKIKTFFVIPKHFFTPDIIEKRKPLSQTARRAGWVGCNILFNNIPQSGKIYIIKNGSIEPKNAVLKNWQRTLFLKEERKIETRGWLLDVMNCIDIINKQKFNLNEIYLFEKTLSKKHPNNKHIKDKIRQQLQILRDRGYIKFIEKGVYQKI